MVLLDRDKFRNSVFQRDSGKCVICANPAKDAHHIIERRLFSNGGYYIENGASLCEKHHIMAETTELSCEEIREKAGIEIVVLPEHLYRDYNYDKWGNIILPNGSRIKGELFYDESVQKILKDRLYLFSDYVKYPRTYHLPWSESMTKDDRIMDDLSFFENRDVVVTEKMDGENTTMYRDYIHARSLDMDSHPSRNWIKNFWSTICYDIPEGWRICGENLFAKHSIYYRNLKSYFYVFSIWNEKNVCLSWKDTIEWATLLNLEIVPVLYNGLYDESIIKNMYHKEINDNESEGYVMRVQSSFNYSEFRKCVGKFVRKNHVRDAIHNWKHKAVVENSLMGI